MIPQQVLVQGCPIRYSPPMGPGSERDTSQRAALRDELSRIEESTKWSAQMQFEATKLWRGVNLALGIPASVLAALAGATALATSTGRVAAGIVALSAAGLGAVLTTINAGDRMNRAASAANAYLEIQTAARQLSNIDLPNLELDEARAALSELTARRDEQNRVAEPPSSRLYKRAAATLKSGGQSYDVDERT